MGIIVEKIGLKSANLSEKNWNNNDRRVGGKKNSLEFKGKTYLLFVRMRIDEYFCGGADYAMSTFDEKLYMSRKDINSLNNEQRTDFAYFPVSVMVVDEKYKIVDKCRESTTPKKYVTSAIIRLLVTKNHLRYKGFGSVMLAKFLEQIKGDVKYVYTITKMNENIFQ